MHWSWLASSEYHHVGVPYLLHLHSVTVTQLVNRGRNLANTQMDRLDKYGETTQLQLSATIYNTHTHTHSPVRYV